MTASWSTDDLDRLHAAGELEIAVEGTDGRRQRWVPIWVVCAGGRVYVRSWYRRDTGWFGRVLRSRRARIRVPGLEADVRIVDVGGGAGDVTGGGAGDVTGGGAGDVTAEVDAAYRTKYGEGGAASMVTAEAAATTLRLDPR